MNDYAKCTGQAGRNEKDIEETINNDAYLNSCNCPVCGKKIREETTREPFIANNAEHVYIKEHLQKRK